MKDGKGQIVKSVRNCQDVFMALVKMANPILVNVMKVGQAISAISLNAGNPLNDGCHHENGFCIEPDTCICKAGWQGSSCSECVPYWICPEDGYCYEPNQCICNSTVTDGDHFEICNQEKINGPMHREHEGECSLKCTEFTAYELPMGPPIGIRATECSWGQTEGLCTPKQRDCFGSQEWEFGANLGTMELDAASCIYGP
ncbi:hypothetical protein TCAL_15455, partial [Tigriopus californicus]